MIYDQAEFDVRCEWGANGLAQLAPISDVVVIVDVLSFTTAVEIATERGGVIFPYPLKGESAAAFAGSVDAELASGDRNAGHSLSPASLRNLPAGRRWVIPSPNGGALSYRAEHPAVVAACLRNAAAIAHAASSIGSRIAVIPAGERWPDGELRPSFEDWVGAGAVITWLTGRRSPEAGLACAAFDRYQACLHQALRESISGKELIERGFEMDVSLAAELNVSSTVPRLIDRAFVATNRA